MASDGTPGVTSDDRRSETQAIINEADYLAIIEASWKKLEAMTPRSEKVNEDKDPLVQFTSRLRTFSQYYHCQVKMITGIDLAGPETDTTEPQGMLHSAPRPFQVGSEEDTVATQSWLPLDLVGKSDTTLLDNMSWNSLLNDFSGSLQ